MLNLMHLCPFWNAYIIKPFKKESNHLQKKKKKKSSNMSKQQESRGLNTVMQEQRNKTFELDNHATRLMNALIIAITDST